MKKIKLIILAYLFLITFCLGISFAQENKAEKPPEIAGEIFGVPVPIGNYYFAKKVVMTFNASWRGIPQTDKELEGLTWQELVLSYESFTRNIEAKDEEIDDEIEKIMKGEKVSFKWRTEKEEFQKWVKEKLQAPVDALRNYLAHLIKIQKLRKQIIDGINPEVTEQEALQKYLDEYNTLSVELIQVDDLKEAEKLYKKVSRDPKAWEEKKKEPKLVKKPGFVALDFLIHMWGFKREDAYKMLDKPLNSFYPPAPIYKGYGVFKIIEVRKAEPAKFTELKNSYLEKVKMIKKYDGFTDWLKKIKEEANIKIFIK